MKKHLEMYIDELKWNNKEVRYKHINWKHVDNISIDKTYKNQPIIVTKDNYIIDGHHRLCAAKKNNEKVIQVIVFDVTFEDSNIYRTFDGDLKWLIRDTNYDFFKTKEERWKMARRFKELLPWIILNLKT